MGRTSCICSILLDTVYNFLLAADRVYRLTHLLFPTLWRILWMAKWQGRCRSHFKTKARERRYYRRRVPEDKGNSQQIINRKMELSKSVKTHEGQLQFLLHRYFCFCLQKPKKVLKYGACSWMSPSPGAHQGDLANNITRNTKCILNAIDVKKRIRRRNEFGTHLEVNQVCLMIPPCRDDVFDFGVSAFCFLNIGYLNAADTNRL